MTSSSCARGSGNSLVLTVKQSFMVKRKLIIVDCIITLRRSSKKLIRACWVSCLRMCYVIIMYMFQ